MVKPKKELGQHFLKEDRIAARIVDSLIPEISIRGHKISNESYNVLEIGPGTGVLTKFLVGIEGVNFKMVEIDRESIDYLNKHFSLTPNQLISGDFLRLDIKSIFESERFAIIGNFPYNISSQILFKILDNKEFIPVTVCMLQKEVAQRIASAPGKKDYGILSVLLQAWYNIDYLFTVDEGSFIPPPKVKSAVIKISRNSRTELMCDEILFKRVIKTTFNQRRKTIRNSIKPIYSGPLPISTLFALRPEQLGVEEFVELTKIISNLLHPQG